MTWKEFKEKVEEAGVTDDMTIMYIDIDDQLDLIIKIDLDDNDFTVE